MWPRKNFQAAAILLQCIACKCNWNYDSEICISFYHSQLEKIIGKLKTEKYGDRILAQIEMYSDFKPPDERNEQGLKVRAAKRSKTNKPIVLVETSEEDEAS